MNSINSVSKYKYQSNVEFPVNLEEYVLVLDEGIDERYLLLKFFNTLSENVHHLECNLKLYNENNFITENIDFSFDGDYPSGYFVPEKKLKISGEFYKLKIEVTKITFDTLYYENNNIKKIPINIIEAEDNNEVVVDSNKWQAKKDKLEYKTTKRNVKLSNKIRYVTQTNRQTKTRLALILTVIFSIITVIYFITSILIYSNNTKILSDDYFDYKIDGKELEVIYCYNSKVDTILIPDKVDGKTVTRIDKEVFKNNKNIKKLILSHDIIIERSAFEGCINLETIENPEYIIELRDYALNDTNIYFDTYPNLKYLGKKALPFSSSSHLSLPKCTLYNGALLNYTELVTLEYGNLADGVGMYNVLSKTSRNTLRQVITNDKEILDSDYLNTNIEKVTLHNKDVIFRCDRLNDGLIKYISLPMTNRSLSQMISISNNLYPIHVIEINNVVSNNSEFFNDINVSNLVVNAEKLTITKLSDTINTIYYNDKYNLTYNNIRDLSNNNSNLQAIYCKNTNSVSQAFINLYDEYSLNDYLTTIN